MTSNLPVQNIKNKIYELRGVQVFDAYIFVSDLIKRANKTIVLIDNYIDEKTLTLLSKKEPQVKANIYTKNINNKLLQDVEKFNEQYKTLSLKKN